jgi:hypothetical protein
MNTVKALIEALQEYKNGGDVDPVLPLVCRTGMSDKNYPDPIEICLEFFGDYFFGEGCGHEEAWTNQADRVLADLIEVTKPTPDMIGQAIDLQYNDVARLGRYLDSNYRTVLDIIYDNPDLFCLRHYCGGTTVKRVKPGGEPHKGFYFQKKPTIHKPWMFSDSMLQQWGEDVLCMPVAHSKQWVEEMTREDRWLHEAEMKACNWTGRS